MSNFLSRVRRDVGRVVDRRREAIPEGDLSALAADAAPPPPFARALRDGPRPRVIAEIKRASPSRGAIRSDASAAQVARAYRDAGAAAISVLTEEKSFLGSLADLAGAAVAVEGRVPLLRKDFIFSRYQLLEARACGASAVLLIAAMQTGGGGGDPSLAELLATARELGLEALVEVHDEVELAAAAEARAEVIGVNSRDLRTLAVDPATHVRLAPLVPRSAVRVAESGIRSRDDIDHLAELGYQAFLVGERLMAEPEPGTALAGLLGTREAGTRP